MARLDEAKELINNIRIGITIIFLMIISLTSGLINRFDKDKIDILFYVGSTIEFSLMIFALLLFKLLKKKTKEIRDIKD